MNIATALLVHAPQDREFVEQVANALCQRGVIPWLNPEEISVNSHPLDNLQEAVEQHILIVLFLSETSIASKPFEHLLRETVRLEKDRSSARWVVPVFLDDPFTLVKDSCLLSDSWLYADGDYVERAHLDLSELTSSSSPDGLADTLSQKIYTLLNFEHADDITLVIDQRGNGKRQDWYDMPSNIARLNNPTLVFRPDIGERTNFDTLVGRHWDTLCQTMQRSLGTALKTVRNRRPKIRIMGNAQLGFAFFFGRYFNRTSYASLYSYHSSGSIFSNAEQERMHPLTAPSSDFPFYLEPQKEYDTVALYLGKEKFLGQAKAHVSTLQPSIPLVWIETLQPGQRFEDSAQIMHLVQKVGGVFSHLHKEHRTRCIRLYCDLPFNALPLLAANLTDHVVETVEFMEYCGGRISERAGTQRPRDTIEAELQAAKLAITATTPGSPEELKRRKDIQDLETELEQLETSPEHTSYIQLSMPALH